MCISNHQINISRYETGIKTEDLIRRPTKLLVMKQKNYFYMKHP